MCHVLLALPGYLLGYWCVTSIPGMEPWDPTQSFGTSMVAGHCGWSLRWGWRISWCVGGGSACSPMVDFHACLNTYLLMVELPHLSHHHLNLTPLVRQRRFARSGASVWGHVIIEWPWSTVVMRIWFCCILWVRFKWWAFCGGLCCLGVFFPVANA